MSIDKTPETIKADSNFLCGLELVDFEFNLYLTYGSGTDNNGIKIEYHAFLKGELLFHGRTFKPSPLIGTWDDLPCIIELLSFLTLQRGAAPSDYFKGYNAAQIDWRESNECESLDMWVGDFKYSETEAYKEAATKYFKQFFII